jgi:hypothetical protein
MFLEKTIILHNVKPKVRNFKNTSTPPFQFSCPLCGDSATNSRRARGYLIFDNGKFFYYCHNCNINLSFPEFLKRFDYALYEEYVRERFKANTDPIVNLHRNSHIDTTTLSNKVLIKLPKISSLKPNHPAKKFIVDRCIPTPYHAFLYYAKEFKKFTNSLVENYFDFTIDEKRIIIPLFNNQKKLIGFQGRALKSVKDRIRYITVMLGEHNPRIFNLNKVDFNKRYYVTEGPFDAMFLSNSIATCGGKITSELEKHSLPITNSVIIYDNQPRNPDVCRNIENAIDAVYSVFIWPKSVEEKDINDWVKKILVNNDLESACDYIQDTIDSHTYSGLEAKLNFTEWRKYVSST